MLTVFLAPGRYGKIDWAAGDAAVASWRKEYREHLERESQDGQIEGWLSEGSLLSSQTLWRTGEQTPPLRGGVFVVRLKCSPNTGEQCSPMFVFA
jgi:hypothetical protein